MTQYVLQNIDITPTLDFHITIDQSNVSVITNSFPIQKANYSEGEGMVTRHKTSTSWVEKMDALDKICISVSSTIIFVGIVDLFAHLPGFMPWVMDLLLIGGGISLFVTSILLAKRIGLK